MVILLIRGRTLGVLLLLLLLLHLLIILQGLRFLHNDISMRRRLLVLLLLLLLLYLHLVHLLIVSFIWSSVFLNRLLFVFKR
jgi:hypothetical protein